MLLGKTVALGHSRSAVRALSLVTALLGLAVFANAPHILFNRGAPSFDLMVHYRWVADTARAMAAGDPWPHWMPSANYGLGEPGLLYYSPLYYLASGLVWQVLGNVWGAMHVVEIAASFVCGLMPLLLARAYGAGRYTLWSGALGVLSPMAIMLNQGFNGFSWSVAIAPASYLFWAMLRPAAPGLLLNAHAIVALAMVICTHTLTGLMCMMCLAPLALLRRDGRLGFDARTFLGVGAVFVGGLLLSAAYLWPALAYKPLIDQAVFTTFFTPWSAFVLPTFTRRFGMHWWALQVPIPLIAFGLATFGGWLLARRAPDERARWLGRAGAISLAVAAFFALEISYPVWRLNTPLNFIQFPFRLTTIAAVLAPMLAAPALTIARGRLRAGLFAASGLYALLACGLLVQLSTQGRHLAFASDQLASYKGLPEYRILTRGPDWERYYKGGLFAGECARLAVRCSARTRDDAGYRWSVTAPAPVLIRVPVFAFPAFVTTVDHRDTARLRDAATGLIAVPIGVGTHDLFVHWRPLPIQRYGEMVTLLSAAGLALAVGLGRRGAGAR